MKNLINKFFDKHVESIIKENIDKYNSEINDNIETIVKENILKYNS